jgi:autotransporter-associated beta strand protein
VGDNNATATFGGVISSDLSLTKIGTGTQTLTGTNTFTGVTNVNNGTLAVNGSLALGVPVNVNASAASAGTLKRNGRRRKRDHGGQQWIAGGADFSRGNERPWFHWHIDRRRPDGERWRPGLRPRRFERFPHRHGFSELRRSRDDHAKFERPERHLHGSHGHHFTLG